MTDIQQQITQVEEQLRQAMLTSDVAVLDQLIADDLLFTNHLGQVLSKPADLEIHRSGVLKFSVLDASEQVLRISEAFATASVRMKVAGVYGDQPFSADLRYTRIWRKDADGQWQVAAGHSSVIQD